MALMARYPDDYFDLAIVDPPYGININFNMGRKRGQKIRHKQKDWDNAAPDKSYFDELFRVSKHQIIWGGNYFPLPPSYHVIWWEKLTPEDLSFSSGELAWTSFNKANKSYTRRNITGDKIHPTQKPVALYKWLLHNYAKLGDKILDTHLGSGSIAIACHDMGFDLVACEIDEDYYNAAMKRLQQHQAQLTLDL